MLKIHKGLKKKKKDKKNKHKEDELFDKEELDKYRKEHEQKQQQAGAGELDQQSAGTSAAKGDTTPAVDQSEEWKKFQALTAGIDNVLKKTQGDLDRIKSTSFFQRKPPPSEEKKKKEEEEESAKEDKDLEDPKGKRESGLADKTRKELEEQAATEADDEESEIEIEDNIFDTSYIDIITSGEVKLAYIPDSPVFEEDGIDPFDTSIADKYIDPKKRYLNLGCAVEVLSGKATTSDKTQPLKEKRSPRRRPKPVDLLLTSFDEGTGNSTSTSVPIGVTPADSPKKTLLDEDPFGEVAEVISSPVKIHENLALKFIKPATAEQITAISEATTVTTELPKQSSAESIDDEFAKLATESFVKKATVPEVIEKAPEKVSNKVGASPTEAQFDSNCHVITAEETKSLKAIPSDVFGSSSDLSGFAVNPIEPFQIPDEVEEEIDSYDPFDTSIVHSLALPGKQEIKILEKELFEDTPIKSNPVKSVLVESDDDFDPRAENSSAEDKFPRPNYLDVVSEQQNVVSILSPSERPDFLKINQEELDHSTKLLTPAIPREDISFSEEDHIADPFDTSGINSTLGKLEVQLIQKELEQTSGLEDPDFNPRETTILEKINSAISLRTSVSESIPSDILTGEDINIEVLHTPVQPKKFDPEENDITFDDPFDTSIAENIKPGQTELKLLETELI